MNYLITGGTGSIGKELVAQLLSNGESGKIVIYSRDEAKQAAMAEEFPEGGRAGLRYIIGDICDYDRLVYAMKNACVVIHAAAMKRIDTCEYNPVESVRVNVLGSLNVARACIQNGVELAMFLSTDKACNPCSAYGAQKAAVERMWIGMNNMTSKTLFNCVRYGNVYGSRGSVIQKWHEAAEAGEAIKVTSSEMSRFFWNIDEAAAFIRKRVLDGVEQFDRGLTYVPKMRSFKMIELALSTSHNIEIIGLRCPEKVDEDLISSVEGAYTNEMPDHYIIYPLQHDWAAEIIGRGKGVPAGFKLSSG